MAFRIQKPSIMPSVGTVYYKGSNQWDETFAKRKLYDTEADAKAEPYIILVLHLQEYFFQFYIKHEECVQHKFSYEQDYRE